MSTPLANVEPTPSGTDVIADPRRKRLILIAMCTALMAVIASVSGLNVAQQELALDFGASQKTILWIINAYTLALAALLMPIGAIGDRWGRKPVLLTGLCVFIAASLAGALAGSAEFLIATRTIAGVGAAMIMPVTLSVITSSFPPEERTQAIGIWAGVAGGGGMIGMFVSAAMVDLVTWRWLFALPIVLLVVALALSVVAVPNSREDSEHPFDIGGSILSLLAIGGLVFGMHEGPEVGWTDPLTVLGIGVGLAAAVGFVLWERNRPAPLLDVSVFADRRLASGSVSLLIVFAVMFGIFLVLFPFFQAVLGWSALRSATALLPMAMVMMPASALVPKVLVRIGSRATMLVGLGIGTVGLAMLALMASVEGGYWSVLPGLMLIGLGMGFTMTPSTEAITSSLPPEKQGVASALNDTTREVGGAFGVALLGAVLASGYSDAVEPKLAGFPDEIASVAGEGIGAAYGVAHLAGPRAPELLDAAQHAFVDAWVQTMWMGVIAMAIAFTYVLVRGPRTAPEVTEPGEDHLDTAEPTPVRG